ncbi:NUDIX domain-containing protein [Planctomonas psychrotolerans]|uniref:NUDIX domain-containing protein n=1 Tax=Planctomonas psychrotolerans TaxID=2528712 RepID=UPI001D0D31C6|nr:NUDIX domain-containing protein [Planctomonas psychrotolerans]
MIDDLEDDLDDDDLDDDFDDEDIEDGVQRGGAGRPPRVAALTLFRNRRLLLVALHDRTTLTLPSASIADGEPPRHALVRGCREELGVEIERTSIGDLFTVLGSDDDDEDGPVISMTVYSGDTADEPQPVGRADGLVWVSSADADRCTSVGADILKRLVQLDLID